MTETITNYKTNILKYIPCKKNWNTYLNLWARRDDDVEPLISHMVTLF